MSERQKFFRKCTALLLSSLFAVAMIGCGGIATKAPEKVGGAYPGTIPSALPNYALAPQATTATSQTVSWVLGGYSSCMVQVTGVSLTTVTFTIEGSTDGTHFFAVSESPYGSSLTQSTSAVTVTSGLPKWYVVNAADLTNLEVVTSGTFTATSVTFGATCSSNKGLL